MLKSRVILAAMFSVLSAAACTPNGTSSPTAAPVTSATTTDVSSTPITRPTAILPDGFGVRIEIASDDETRARGLMYRESLPEGKGMLFFFPKVERHSFWMKNTLIPLDMIWLDTTGKVVEVVPNVPPCPGDPCPSFGGQSPSSYVLELGAGQASKHKVTVGSSITLQGIGDVRIR